jgi:hypothetical protein
MGDSLPGGSGTDETDSSPAASDWERSTEEVAMRGSASISVAALSLLLTACGEMNAPADRSGEEVIGGATVLEDREHGPQLCLGGVLDSYPPQCGGPDLIGWDWGKVSGSEDASGVRWGEYVVIGTYDKAANSLTLTRPAVPADSYKGNDFDEPDEEVLTTPCTEPAGGWRVVDPSLTTAESMVRALQQASQRSDYASAWLDQSINPAAEEPIDPADEGKLNDPTKLILNVATTSAPSGVEAELRKIWGGALCVSRAEHTEAEMRAIQDELVGIEGMLSASSSVDRVELGVVWDDGSLQRELDAKYGVGLVVVITVLKPYPS